MAIYWTRTPVAKESKHLVLMHTQNKTAAKKLFFDPCQCIELRANTCVCVCCFSKKEESHLLLIFFGCLQLRNICGQRDTLYILCKKTIVCSIARQYKESLFFFYIFFLSQKQEHFGSTFVYQLASSCTQSHNITLHTV